MKLQEFINIMHRAQYIYIFPGEEGYDMSYEILDYDEHDLTDLRSNSNLICGLDAVACDLTSPKDYLHPDLVNAEVVCWILLPNQCVAVFIDRHANEEIDKYEDVLADDPLKDEKEGLKK